MSSVDCFMSDIDAWKQLWRDAGIEYGLCLCGCGEPTTVARYDHRPTGAIQGEPRRYLHNHAHRKSPVEYVEQDCGYDSPCWVWQRAINRRGYGMTGAGVAYRAYYKRFVGPIPPKHDLHHKCENPPCVNPAHLVPLTRSAHLRLRADTRLDAGRVAEIKRRLSVRTTKITPACRTLAAEFGVSISTIRAIYDERIWADVTPAR